MDDISRQLDQSEATSSETSGGDKSINPFPVNDKTGDHR